MLASDYSRQKSGPQCRHKNHYGQERAFQHYYDYVQNNGEGGINRIRLEQSIVEWLNIPDYQTGLLTRHRVSACLQHNPGLYFYHTFGLPVSKMREDFVDGFLMLTAEMLRAINVGIQNWFDAELRLVTISRYSCER